MFKKKILSLLLSASMVATPVIASAAEIPANQDAEKQTQVLTDTAKEDAEEDSEHNFENKLDSDEDLSGLSAFGKDMDSTSGSGLFTTSIATADDGTKYLNATLENQGGSRGSKLIISDKIVKEANVNFDLLPVSVSDTAYGQIIFTAPGKTHSYFTLRFDKDGNISYFTENPLSSSSTKQNAFDNSISAANPVQTGLTGLNTWYNVNLNFDYVAHTVDITIKNKSDATKSYTIKGVAIETEANGVERFVIHLNRNSGKVGATIGIDNLTADMVECDDTDIVSVVQPNNINLAGNAYDDYEFPSEVTVRLKDGTEKTVRVGVWECDEFDGKSEGDFIWTAPLQTGALTNCFDLCAEFKMHYTNLPYPIYVYAPATLELQLGEDFNEESLPEKVTASMSDGTLREVVVDKWVPIRAFDKKNSGIYIYAAMIKPVEGEYEVIDSLITPNEHPGTTKNGVTTYTEQYKNELAQTGINYDDYQVYYRVTNYPKDADNYNGYARSMGYVNRGVYAIQVSDANKDKYNGIFVSWRLMPDEYGKPVEFYVYRNGELITETPITDVSYYIDAEGKAGDKYKVVTKVDGVKYDSNEFEALEQNYLSIKLQKPAPQKNAAGTEAEYTLNDASVADVDGDGEYEFIVKWNPSNAFDSGKKTAGGSAPAIFDVYEMDGTALWRLNGGLELPCGAHYNQFILYDLDEDGKAELFFKTSDGTRTYKPNSEGLFDMDDENTLVAYIGDKSVVPGQNVDLSSGHMKVTTNEYVTIFNGATGEVIDTIDYVNSLSVYNNDWYGDNWGNRSSRMNMAVAYLPKDKNDPNCKETIPAVIFQRGYYANTNCAAYTLRDGKITLEWNYVSQGADDDMYCKGNHNIAIGDVDNDGFDEIIYGSAALDHDGTVLWSKNGKNGQDFAGHADTIHLTAMFPDSKQLYLYGPEEDKTSSINDSVSNAATGVRIASQWTAPADIGRAVAANITSKPGFELWANQPNNELGNVSAAGPIYNVYGDIITTTKPVNFTTNWALYWDGDLLNELPDSYMPSEAEGHVVVWKYNENTNEVDNIAEFEGTKLNNWTKNTACFTGDIMGDWRDEIMVRNEDDTELRIYMTDYETEYMIYSLMYDPVYRMAVVRQNTSYNQPAHLGFYLGEDIKDQVLNMELPVPNITWTVEKQTPVVDKEALEALIKAKENIVEDGHNAKEWAAFSRALRIAKEIDAKQDATVEEVEQALGALSDASEALTASVKFADVPDGQWYTENVKYVYDRGYMVGKNSDNGITFAPADTLTRAEAIQILYSIAGKPTARYEDIFDDVAKDQWYTSAIMWAAKNGIAVGKADNMFDVAGNVTRQELAVMMSKYAKYNEIPTSIGYDLSKFADADSVQKWGKAAIQWAAASNIISGKKDADGKLIIAPDQAATRAETATMYHALINNVLNNN